jgi:hypothetical protein
MAYLPIPRRDLVLRSLSPQAETIPQDHAAAIGQFFEEE